EEVAGRDHLQVGKVHHGVAVGPGAAEVPELHFDTTLAQGVFAIVGYNERSALSVLSRGDAEAPRGALLRDDLDPRSQELRVVARVSLVMIGDDEDFYGLIGDLGDPAHLAHQWPMKARKLSIDQDHSARAEPQERVGSAPGDQVETGCDELRSESLAARARRRGLP